MKVVSHRIATASMFKTNCLALLVGIALSSSVYAQEASTKTRYTLSSGDLVKVVNEISRNSGLQIVYEIEDLQGLVTVDIKGELTVGQALDKALRGTGLGWTQVNPTTISIKKRAPATTRPNQKDTDAKPRSGSSTSADPGSSVQDLEELVVVGSRLGTSPVESAMPIKVITREQIDRSGASSIAQALTYLPEVPINSLGDRPFRGGTGVPGSGNTNSTTVQMRGLARGTTLVLINGRRAGDSALLTATGQFDLSAIPLALVDRIEVLPSGSSAAYGGDGLAGVINIVLRKDASGFELRTKTSIADGFDTTQISALWGKSWSRGKLTIAANWNKNSALMGSERDITGNRDYRRFGYNDVRSTVSNPGNVYSLSGCPVNQYCYVPLGQRGNLPGLNSSIASVPADQDGTGLVPGDFLATQGLLTKTTPLRHLRSAEEGYGLSLEGSFEVTSSLEAFAELSYTKRETPAYQNELGLQGGQYGDPAAIVPANNPFNPFGVAVGVDYYFKDTGLYTKFDQEHYRGLLGMKGRLGKFEWEVTGLQSRDKALGSGPLGFDRDAIREALAQTDPARALNPFAGNGNAPASDDVLRSLTSDYAHNAMTRTTILGAQVRGPLLKLPAGSVVGLLGVERQRQSVSIDSNSVELVTTFVDGSTSSDAYFAEARVPIMSPRANEAYERVAITGAIRSETSDRSDGSTKTQTSGIEVRPFESLLLRATYGTAFRPLLAYDTVQIPRVSEIYVNDPTRDPDFYFPVNGYTSGGVPVGIVPERSTTTTMGLLYRPSPEWSFSLTHWDTKFRDRIQYIDYLTIIQNESLFPGRVRRDPESGTIVFLDARQVNVARNDSAGVDIAVDGGWTSSIGSFYASVGATYTYKYEQQLSKESDVTHSVSVHDPEGWAPRWKIVPRLEWEANETLTTTMIGRYVSRYRDSVELTTGPDAGRYRSLGDFWLVDLNATISLSRIFSKNTFLRDSKISVGATNLFDKLPVYCCGYSGYDASQYDILGRSVYAELRIAL